MDHTSQQPNQAQTIQNGNQPVPTEDTETPTLTGGPSQNNNHQQLLQKLKSDFNGHNGNNNASLTDGELANEMAKKPLNPLEAILAAEQKKELRLNDVRKDLNTNGKSKEEILKRYPKSPFDSN